MIRSPAYLDQVRLQALKDGKPWYPMPSVPLADSFLVLIMIDSERDMAVLAEKDLSRWGISLEEAMEVAHQNLERLDASPCMRLGPGLLRSAWNDGYDTSRILQPSFIASLGFAGEPVALLPHRECLLLADANDDASLARMAEIAKAEFEEARFISAIPLVHRQGAWQPFASSSTSTSTRPGAHALAVLGRDGRMHDYEEQRTILDGVHALGDGTAPYVSPCRLIGNHVTGTNHTCASWTKGVPTLLPKCEFIGLVDMERAESESFLGIFRWADLERACGSLLKPVGMTPERWLTCGFPDDEVIRGLEHMEFWRKG